MTRAIGMIVSIASILAADAAQVPTFRSATEVVLVPVWVTDGNRRITGLTAADFQLLDNGVVQEVASVSAAAHPIDVTLVLDTSGSVRGGVLEVLKTGVQEVGRGLRTDDRVRLLTFATSVADVFGTRAGGSPLPIDRIEAGGETSFYNALSAALISTAANDRPQLIFGLSDGLDTQRFLDARDVVALAGASSAALYLAVRGQSPGSLTGGVPSPAGGNRWIASPFPLGREKPNLPRLREIVARTGGLLFENPATGAMAALFARAIEDFRTSYLLTFTPRGVARDGWHELSVRIRDKRVNVRARQGYAGR